MLALVRENLRHIFRSRLLFSLLLFSFVVHFLGLSVLHHLTVSIQGVITLVGPKQAVFVSLFFQLFLGTFLSAIYGIWMVPYSHQGPRSLLTFTLPVAKWKFPLGYALSFFFLLILEYVVMFLGFGAEFGFATFVAKSFPWVPVLICLLLETIAFETVAFAFADASLLFGQIPTFFMGMLVFFVLQVGGTLSRFGIEKFIGHQTGFLYWVFWIYRKLPPAGEIVFDLKNAFVETGILTHHFILWGIWFLVFVVLFRLQLRYPARLRSSEA